MLLGTKKSLYDLVTEALLVKPMNASQLEGYLDARNISATIQGIYKALRELINEDIVVKQDKIYFISSVWRKKLETLVSQRPPFRLSSGEHMSYRFNKIGHLDMFWKHIINDIQNELDKFPVFHANPHNFWYLVPGRGQSEEEYREIFPKTEKFAFTLIGGQTSFDESQKRKHGHLFHQFHFENNYPFNRRDHLSVIGPYIITTRVSVSLARITDQLYQTCFTEKELQEKLEPEFAKHGSVIMTVEHNEEKAKRLRKRMSADFHIPRELREKYSL